MIFNMVGGGAGGAGGGATLVVSSPANVSITVSKDDKSYTKNSGSLGSATFKGLATGTWTIVIAGNGQTATKTIKITADYAITIAFFSASINITYPATSTCVVKNSGGQTVASNTNTGTSAKTWTATVNATGTYTITATATDGSGDSATESVKITSEGQSVSVELSYRVPSDYQAVEYIQNTNSAFIDTGISPAVNFSCQMRIAADAYGDGLFGIYQSLTPGNSTYRAEIYANESQKSWRLSVGTTTTNIQGKDLNSVVLGELVDLKYEQSANSQSLTGFGKSVQHSYTTTADPYCTFFRYIGGIDYRGKGKLAHAVMHNDGVLVRDMWACYRKSDGVAGMWDRVSKTFLTNAGTGTFVVGADI